MSITADFYTFAKKENSTAVYGGSKSTYNIILKDGCGVVNPVIRLTGISDPTAFNMVDISTFGRKYYINEWTYDRGFWDASCSVDVLGSYKGNILSNYKYVLRNSTGTVPATDPWNPDIIDGYYPTESGLYTQGASFSDPWDTPCIVLAVPSKTTNSGTRGIYAYYCFTPEGIAHLFNYLMGEPAGQNSSFLDDILALPVQLLDRLVVDVQDPLSNIKSAMYFPFTPTSITAISQFDYGFLLNVSLGNGSYLINNYMAVETGKQGFIQTVSIPKHPQATARGRYLNSAPYSQYILDYQPYGRIPIDANLIKNDTQLKVQQSVDLITGEGCLYIFGIDADGNQHLINTVFAQVGCNVPLGQLTSDPFGLVNNIAAGFNQIAEGSFVSGSGSLVSALGSMNPPMREAGTSSGTILPYVLNYPYLEHRYQRIVDENYRDAGRPVSKWLQLSTLTGFTQVSDGEIAISGTPDEKSQIRSYLEGGFYIE